MASPERTGAYKVPGQKPCAIVLIRAKVSVMPANMTGRAGLCDRRKVRLNRKVNKWQNWKAEEN